MKIQTESGSVYCLTQDFNLRLGAFYRARKDGEEGVGQPVVGIYPDRLPYLLASVRLERDGNAVNGFNEVGTRTFRFIPMAVSKGMILANRHGLRSTRIVKILAD